MSKTNNRRLRARVRRLEEEVMLCRALLVFCECAYCYEILENNRATAEAHAKVCAEHPCRALEAELEPFLAARRSREMDL